MNKLNLPQFDFRVRKENNTLFIFDQLRKKELVLTPEEWVRQNLIQFLIEFKSFPAGLISIEAGLKINTLQRRYDALVFSREGNAHVLIECKAPEVKITKKVFEQILAYNIKISAPHLLVSNGLNHYFLSRNKENNFKFQQDIPLFSDLV